MFNHVNHVYVVSLLRFSRILAVIQKLSCKSAPGVS